MNYLQMLKRVPVKIGSPRKHITLYRLMTLLVLYKSYGMYQAMKREQMLVYKETWDNNTKNTLMTDTGLVVENFKPSYFVLSGVAQTLFAALARLPVPEYDKEILKLSDGGQLCLQSIVPSTTSKGVIVIVPGLCGDGSWAYIVNTVNKAVENDYSVYVVNHRGLCDTKLLTPVTYHGGSSFDVKEAINYIESKHPQVSLYGISFSLGSNILGRYLGEEGENSKLSGAICVCWPFNSLEASAFSEKSWFGLISRYLAWSSKRMLKLHEDVFPLFKEALNIDVNETLNNIKKFRDFDNKITAPIFGYTGYIDYYSKCWVVPILKNIQTKTLFISSLDDPFFGPDVIPFEEFKENENIFLMATSGGGHVGFYDTILSTEQWVNKPSFKFLNFLNTFDRFHIKA